MITLGSGMCALCNLWFRILTCQPLKVLRRSRLGVACMWGVRFSVYDHVMPASVAAYEVMSVSSIAGRDVGWMIMTCQPWQFVRRSLMRVACMRV